VDESEALLARAKEQGIGPNFTPCGPS